MPEQPHEFTVRSPETEEDYVALFEAISAHSVRERYGQRWYRYLRPGDGWRYWAMTSAGRATSSTAPGSIRGNKAGRAVLRRQGECVIVR